MKHGEVLGEGVDVACAVDEGVVHVPADLGARVRNERDAAATDRLGADEPIAFLQARQDEQVARPHEVGMSVRCPRTRTLGCEQL